MLDFFMDFTEITKFFFFQSADAPCFLEFDDASSIPSSQVPTNATKRCWVYVQYVIMALVNCFAMKKKWMCSVTWSTPLSAETCSPKFLFHDRALDEQSHVPFCDLIDTIVISNAVFLALQEWTMASPPWRRSSGIRKAVCLGEGRVPW
jgi:hypothetical protein